MEAAVARDHAAVVGEGRAAGQVERLAERAAKGAEGYPPYNIEHQAPDGFTITLAVAGFAATQEMKKVKGGDFGFDPLGLSKEEGAFFAQRMRSSEIFNGRLAMLAITGFAVQEFLWQKPVIAQTPFFFGR